MELNYLLSDNSLVYDSYHSTLFGNSDIGSLTNASLDDNNNNFISIALPDFSHETLTADPGLTLSNPVDTTMSPQSSDTVARFVSLQESSLSDEESTLSPKSRRSVKHSISEKKRVIRFNQCIDSFMEMLGSNGVRVRRNKLCVLLEAVRLIEQLQSEVSELRKKEKEKQQQQHQLQKLKIMIPQPESSQQEYYHFLHSNGASMIIITISGIILDANSLFCQSVNRDSSHVIGSSFFSFAHSSTLPFFYSTFSAFLSGSKSSCQFIQVFSFHNHLTPHCFTVFYKDGNFIVFLFPLMNGESLCNAGNSMFLESNTVFSISGKSFCLLGRTELPMSISLASTSCAYQEFGCKAVDAYNLESPKSPCVEVQG